MNFSLSIPGFQVFRRPTKVAMAVRVVPEPKIFDLPIKWEESTEQPRTVPVRCQPNPSKTFAAVESVIRRSTPLELRLDPEL